MGETVATANIDDQFSVGSGLSCISQHSNVQQKKEQIGNCSLLLASDLLAVVCFYREVRAQKANNVAQSSTAKEGPSTVAQVTPSQEGLTSAGVIINLTDAVTTIFFTFAYGIAKTFK